MPVVAIFTSHDTAGEKAGTSVFQTQSIAYSLDEGKSWEKYKGNPVLKNPGIRDFRDPKVSWYAPQKKWIMTLATQDRITFYSSKNLIDWIKESEFGDKSGAHGGVWECPDLFYLNDNGKQVWVLLVSINPGGPNGGSATQYFIGDFDGSAFKASHADTRWIDYGPDNYAGVTWSNTGYRKIFLGWMSNWTYANKVPTVKWRSAMTLPRDLQLQKMGGTYHLQSMPIYELSNVVTNTSEVKNIRTKNYSVTRHLEKIALPLRFTLDLKRMENFTIKISNESGENILAGFDKQSNNFFIDRTNSGIVDFSKEFSSRAVAPRISNSANLTLTLVLDQSSIEMFADDGLSVMTALFFPKKAFTDMQLSSDEELEIRSIKFQPLRTTLAE